MKIVMPNDAVHIIRLADLFGPSGHQEGDTDVRAGGWRFATLRGAQRRWHIRWRTGDCPVIPTWVSEWHTVLGGGSYQMNVEYLVPTLAMRAEEVKWSVLEQEPVADYRLFPTIEVMRGRCGGEPTMLGTRITPWDLAQVMDAELDGDYTRADRDRAIREVASDYMVTPRMVEDAVAYRNSPHARSLNTGKYTYTP